MGILIRDIVICFLFVKYFAYLAYFLAGDLLTKLPVAFAVIIISFISMFFGCCFLFVRYPISKDFFYENLNKIGILVKYGVFGGVLLGILNFPYRIVFFNAEIPELYVHLFSDEGVTLYISLLLIIFVGPFVEEVLFRGIVFRELFSRANFIIAASFSSIMFLMLHEMYLSPFVSSFFLCFLYQRYKLLGVCFLSHAIWNFIWIVSISSKFY